MDPITFSLIMLGATVGSSLIRGIVQSKSNDKNRESAKGVFERNRTNTLNQLKVTNKLSTDKLNLNDKVQQQDQQMFNEYKVDKNTEKNYLLNKTSQSFLGNAASKTVGVGEQDWLKKSRILSRF